MTSQFDALIHDRGLMRRCHKARTGRSILFLQIMAPRLSFRNGQAKLRIHLTDESTPNPKEAGILPTR